MSGKIICPECHGNGYIRIQVDEERKVQGNCETCKSQGEVDITEEVLSMLEASGRRLV
jgi:DnaJ-class molecular chaperone